MRHQTETEGSIISTIVGIGRKIMKMGGPGGRSGPGGASTAAPTSVLTPRRLLFAACAASALTVGTLLCAIGARSGDNGGGEMSRRDLVRRNSGGRRASAPPHGPRGGRGGGPVDGMTGEGRPDDGVGSATGDFFERNGLSVPPLVPRWERLRALLEGGRPTSYRRRDEEADGNGDADIRKYFESLRLIGGEEADGEEADAASTVPLMPVDETLEFDASTRLRREILNPESYDKHAYPWSYAWAGQPEGTRTGVPVEVGINFHRVFSVDVINPVLGEFCL